MEKMKIHYVLTDTYGEGIRVTIEGIKDTKDVTEKISDVVFDIINDEMNGVAGGKGMLN